MTTAADNQTTDSNIGTGSKAKDMLLYDQMRIRTTSRKGLICFMHGKALSLIKKGVEGSGNRRDIEKAQNLIFQLELAVNKDNNEDASKMLADLYAYCYYLLEKTEPHGFIAAKTIMGNLAEAFNRLAKQRKI